MELLLRWDLEGVRLRDRRRIRGLERRLSISLARKVGEADFEVMGMGRVKELRWEVNGPNE